MDAKRQQGFTLPPARGVRLIILCALVYLSACDRERREYRAAPLAENGPQAVTVSDLHAGDAPPPAPDPRGFQYEQNAYHLSQGKRLFDWFNCSGCHASGGGGIGPSLMDGQWRYGGTMDRIFETIMDGRPNGMPSFRGKIPDQQVWELAAYVRALSGNAAKAALPSRSEGISAARPPSQTPKQPPKMSEP